MSGTKVWQYSYKFLGKNNTYTIGQYCPKGRAGYVGTAEARKIRDQIKEMIDQVIDPNRHKQTQQYGSEEKAKTTFEAVERDGIKKVYGSPSIRQRPIFKTNVQEFVSLRKTQPPIELEDLLRINEFFPTEGMEFALDPSYEPESDNPDAENTAIFSILQKYNRVNLLVPVNAPHMYYAAMESKSCKLTVL